MEKSLKEKIIGAWSLASFVRENREGEVTYPLGENAKGSLYYLPDGHVSVHIMQTGRQITLAPSVLISSDLCYNELGYLAYSGRYHLNEEQLLMTHEVDVAFYPEWVGSAQIRKIELKENYLELRSDGPIGPESFQFSLRWLKG